ncbi:MAG: DNA mismatch repair endonuclease MutL [Flavobacteriales bacterium]
MSDIIKLLPDSVANQIAAGEVVQRPASVVKELLENAIDSGASSIQLIVKEAGKTLIQVIDNGKGMSDTDARMSFERHATSKISKADDLFCILTKGFRGEALASIAAIAHVDLKTRQLGKELGTHIRIEGSKFIDQQPCATPEGTSMSVKNLFYNVPARRKFLKSDSVEVRHIIDEFQRVALIHPHIAFSYYNNEDEIYHLEKGSFRQRIVGVFGSAYNQRLVPVEEENNNIVKVTGYVGKPEFAKKTRGEQFFFVNGRFIKNNYLNHAVATAYDELLGRDSFASYFIALEVDPSSIDINIHPTKTEIKFEDEKSVYAIVRATVKQALSKYSVSPSLDFERETLFDNAPEPKMGDVIQAPKIKVDPNYNPFRDEVRPAQRQKLQNQWEEIYRTEVPVAAPAQKLFEEKKEENAFYYQFRNKYIITIIEEGLLIIDQHRAHKRILYEYFTQMLENNKGTSQQILFPESIEMNPADYQLMKDMEEDFRKIGFDITEFGKNTYVVNGLPADIKDVSPKALLEGLLEEFKENKSQKIDRRDQLAKSMANQTCIKSGQTLSLEEMQMLVQELFLCEKPTVDPNGNTALWNIDNHELLEKFK